MLYWIAEQLGFPGLLNLIRYISFRAGAATATALAIGLFLGPVFIRWLRAKQGKGQPIRADGPQSHLAKRGTPTMGGLLILVSLATAVLLWMDLENVYVWACLLVTAGFGLIGFLDDYDKVKKAHHAGLRGRTRLLLEFLIAGFATWLMVRESGTELYLPFVQGAVIDLSWAYIVFGAFVIVAFGNAVNLTDGLDGLATMPVIIAAVAFTLIAYLVGNALYSEYLGIPFVRGAGDLTVLLLAVVGAGLAFLWFNAPPAAVFMGDTGSLALGGALGAVAVATHHEFVLVIVGGLFVLEAVSVIVQVFWFKRYGKRIFRMAPIHHHFEHLGWSEPTVVIRFWIISFILALAGLSTLKLQVITAKAFAGKHYAVLGLARSGQATVEALLASGARVTAWDDKEAARAALQSSPSLLGEMAARSADGGAPPPSSGWSPSPSKLGEDLIVADFLDSDLSQFDSIVVTPGLPLNRHSIAQRAAEAGVEIIGDIELFARARAELPAHKVVGITGTNGKSTTTALVHHILQTASVPSLMGGNIGLPILAQDPLPEGGVYVLELSSYQIDLTQSLDCDVAVLLNITPDHLDRYESFEAYAASKVRLFEMQSRGRLAIVATDDETTQHILKQMIKQGWWELIEVDGSEYNGLASGPALKGPHNSQNAACARLVAAWANVGREALDRALESYPGLPHRMERVAEKNGVLFVNDSKATNPTATAPALAAFPNIRWIIGGQAKTDNLDECAPHFDHVRKAYTIGEAGEMFASLLSPHMAVAECVTLDAAVKAAAGEAEPGDTVLLSPACASFDQFKDYEARGDAFRAAVGAL